jgi:hypothetical protein
MRLIPALLVITIGCLGGFVRAGAPDLPSKLTPDTFEAIQARVALTPADLAWQRTSWRFGFFEGLRDAQAADKPIFLWFYGGGLVGDC